MARFGLKVCEKCRKAFKPQGFAKHKCGPSLPPVPKYKECEICHKKISASFYKKHVGICKANKFWVENRAFFLFFSMIVKRFNLTIKKQQVAEDTRKIKEHLFEVFEGIKRTKEDWELMAEGELENRENEIDRKIIEACEEKQIDPKNLKLKRAIRDVIKDKFANLSVRQLVLSCVYEKGLLTPQIKHILDKKLKYNDLPTDEEIKNNGDLFYNLEKLRRQTGYYHYYDEYYQIAMRHLIFPDFYKCPYCKKYIRHIKKHIRKCVKFPEVYEADKENSIKNFLVRYYYDEYIKWPEYKLQYFLNYYKNYPYKYFLSSVDAHVKNSFTFRRKIEEGKRKFAQMTAPKFNIKDFIKSVDDWDPKGKIEEKEFAEDDIQSQILSAKSERESDAEGYGEHFDYLKDEEKKVKSDDENRILSDEEIQSTASLFFKFKKRPLPPQAEEEEEEEDEDPEPNLYDAAIKLDK